MMSIDPWFVKALGALAAVGVAGVMMLCALTRAVVDPYELPAPGDDEGGEA